MARRASRSASRVGYRRPRSLGCRRSRACALAEHRDLAGRRGANAARGSAGIVSVPWWLIGSVALGLVTGIAPQDGEALGVFGDRAGMIAFAVRVGLSVVGLVLVERLFRGTAAHARWAVKPLCLGLAALFGFDLLFYSDAMLFGRHDPNLWAARGAAHALVIPFLAVAAARNPAWTIEMHLSRGAVMRSTALLVSGLFLLAVAAAGYFVRFVGGEFGKVLQIEFLFAALLLFALAAFSGSFRSKLKVFVSKHFFSYRYDHREEWLRLTRTLSADRSPQGIQQRSINALADLVESPAGALWLRDGDQSFRPAARWNMSVITAVEPADGSLGKFLERTNWVIDLTEYAASPERYPGLSVPQWLLSLPGAWLVVPLPSPTGLVGFVVLVTARASIKMDWEVLDLLKTAGSQAASYLGQIQATEARGTQVRCVQSHVGVCSARSEEPGGAIVAAAAECGTPPQQPGVSARHAAYGRQCRRANEQVDAAIEDRGDAGREPALGESRKDHTQRLRGQVGAGHVDRGGSDARYLGDGSRRPTRARDRPFGAKCARCNKRAG